MFLSGFLVKSAAYGFYKLSSVLGGEVSTFFYSSFLVVGVVDASLKLWAQTDLKKLVAYCTIQEMNLIFLMFCWGQTELVIGGVVFCVAHSFLSALLFYTVDCIQKRYHTRSIVELQGIMHLTPNLGTVVFANLVIYAGIPGTLKFSSELFLYSMLVESAPFTFFFFVFFVNFVGVVGFSKC